MVESSLLCYQYRKYEDKYKEYDHLENYWNLKVIDSIESPFSIHDIPIEERQRIIDALINTKKIKNVLLNYDNPSDQKDKSMVDLG